MLPVFKRRGLFGGRSGVLGGGFRSPVVRINHTKNGTFTCRFLATSATIYCDPGNGDAVEELVLSGAYVDFDYVNDGTPRQVRVWGDLDQITYFKSLDVNIFGLDLLPFKNLSLCLLSDNDLTSYKGIRLSDLTFLYLDGNNITSIDNLPGAIPDIDFLRLDDNPIVYPAGGYTWTTQTGGTFKFDSTVSTAAEVDQWLIDLDDASWSNCTIYIDGTNPAPTAASAAAIAALAGRGCTVYTN